MSKVDKSQIYDAISRKKCISAKEIAALISAETNSYISEDDVRYTMRRFEIESNFKRCNKRKIIKEVMNANPNKGTDWILERSRQLSSQRISRHLVREVMKKRTVVIMVNGTDLKDIKNYIVRMIMEVHWISDKEISSRISKQIGTKVSALNIRKYRKDLDIKNVVKRVGVDSIIAIEMDGNRKIEIKDYRRIIFDRTGYKITKKEIEESMYRAEMRPLIQEIDSMLERRPHFEDVDILFNLNKKSEWSEVTKPEVKWVLKHLKSDYR